MPLSLNQFNAALVIVIFWIAQLVALGVVHNWRHAILDHIAKLFSINPLLLKLNSPSPQYRDVIY